MRAGDAPSDVEWREDHVSVFGKVWELLDAEASNYHQYTTILPRRGESEMHMLWWSEVEREALIGSNAALECESLSVEVREVGRMLGLGMLADKVRRHGRVEVQEAVRCRRASGSARWSLPAWLLWAYTTRRSG